MHHTILPLFGHQQFPTRSSAEIPKAESNLKSVWKNINIVIFVIFFHEFIYGFYASMEPINAL